MQLVQIQLSAWPAASSTAPAAAAQTCMCTRKCRKKYKYKYQYKQYKYKRNNPITITCPTRCFLNWQKYKKCFFSRCCCQTCMCTWNAQVTQKQIQMPMHPIQMQLRALSFNLCWNKKLLDSWCQSLPAAWRTYLGMSGGGLNKQPKWFGYLGIQPIALVSSWSVPCNALCKQGTGGRRSSVICNCNLLSGLC